MLQVIHRRRIIQAVAFAAGGKEAVWFEKSQISEFVLQDGDKTSVVGELARGKSRFWTFLQFAFTQLVCLLPKNPESTWSVTL